VYEGDKVLFSPDNNEENKDIYIVTWDERYKCVCLIDKKDGHRLDGVSLIYGHSYEVTGNIHQ